MENHVTRLLATISETPKLYRHNLKTFVYPHERQLTALTLNAEG